MSEFYINHKGIEKETEHLGHIADSINRYKDAIRAIKIDDSGAYAIVKQKLGELVDELEREAGSVKEMQQTLGDINRLYQQTEKRIMNGSVKTGADDVGTVIQQIEDILDKIIASLKGGNNKEVCYGGDPVNLSTGNFIYEKADIKINGTPEFAFVRFYNEMDRQEGSLGRGWYHPYEVRLLMQGDEYTVLLEDGKEVHFQKIEDAVFVCENSCNQLMHSEDGYQYQTQQGTVYYFNQSGQYVAWEDRAGNRLNLSYEEGKLSRVVREKDGAYFSFSYDNDGHLIGVTDHSSRGSAYEYDENGQLHRAENAQGEAFQYVYDANGRMAKLVNPTGTVTLENEYDAQGRTVCQKFSDGGSMSYQYNDEAGQVILTERNGSRITYCHDEYYRNVRTIYEDGEETFAYNERGQRTMYKDCNGNITQYAYDNRGNLTQVIDAAGVKSNATYDENNQLIKMSVNGIEQLKNTYDSQGNLIESRDALGRTTTFSYQENGRPSHIKRPDGATMRLFYDEKGNIAEVIDVYGQKTNYEYDNKNRVILTVDPKGGRTTYAYDEMNRVTAFTNPLGEKTEYFYNACGKQEEVRRADGGVIRTEYNSLNRPSAIINAEGNRAEFTYDNMWNLSEVLLPNGATEQYSYDKRNRLSEVTDALGNCIEFEYDANGNRVLVRSPKGEETQYKYDARNQVVCIVDGDENVTSFEYNERGLLTKQIDAMGNEKVICYDKAGQKISETDAMGNTKHFTYTALGKIETITDAKNRTIRYEYEVGGRLAAICHPDGNKECFTYDANGNVKTHQSRNGYVRTYEYDAMNRILQVKGSNGEEQNYTYDLLGNVASVTDALGHKTSYEYSLTGQLTKVIDAMGNETTYNYDVLGNMIAICQQGETEHITKYERNLKGQIERVTDALGFCESYIYDANGQLTEKIDKEGFITTYGYTAHGDMEHIRYADGREASFAYNPLRQLTEIKDWMGVTRIENDALGRATKVTHPDGKEISYTYGDVGERLSLTYPDGRTVYYGYDENLRLSELKDGDSIITYGYDEVGRLAEKHFPNGMRTTYAYDKMGRISNLMHEDGEGVLDSYRYTYDLLGNKTGIDKTRRGLLEESGSWTYGYDALGRLCEVKKDGVMHQTYSYDAFGNRIREMAREKESIFEYNELNQLIHRRDMIDNEINETEYIYDLRGNLTQVMENGIASKSYTYGALNRLEEATNLGGQTAKYDYNGLGFRVGKSIRNANTDAFNKIWYTLDLTRNYHNMLQREEDERTQTWLWDGKAIAMAEGEEKNYYLQDEMGSPIRLADEEGRLTDSYGYGAFGEDLYQNQGKIQPFGYTGYQMDEITDTYFAQAREYMPQVGRFVAKDVDMFIRMKKPLTNNLYLYCKGNPINYIDATGYDSYVFYDPENFQNGANGEKERLENEYGETVHLIAVTSNEELAEQWNAIEDDSIDEISLLFHGQPHALIINESTNSVLTTNQSGVTSSGTEGIYIGELAEFDSIKKINVISCNVGHLDHQNNVASTFLKTQNVEEVSAWDGSIVYNRKYGVRDYGFGRYEPSLAYDQHYFKSWVRDETQFLFWKWKRAPYGNVNYRFNEEGEIVVDTWIRNQEIELIYSECTDGYSEACCEG